MSTILAYLLILYAALMLPPIGVSLLYQDGQVGVFLFPALVTLLIGALLWFASRKKQLVLRTRDGFWVVTLFWGVMSSLGAIPLLLALHIGVVDALFESASAFTTTGATVLSNLDSKPASVLFYRQILQWYGGIGVVVIAVAILPLIGVGGMQLLKAETPGPMKDIKLTPRVSHTARAIGGMYIGITIACAVFYWLAGMTFFDAVAHSFSTVSTGGFSTHDASFAYFNNVEIEVVAQFFMFVSGIGFGVHFLAVRALSVNHYVNDTETRAYFFFILVVVGLIILEMFLKTDWTIPQSFRAASFTTISVVTSTGFGIDDFSVWPGYMPVLLIFASFVGGCAGSTAGGMKVIRYVMLVQQMRLEVLRLVHPRIIKSVHFKNRAVGSRVVEAVWGFFAIYIFVFSTLMLLVMNQGMDQVSAFGAVATSLNNLGPGLGTVATSFAGVTGTAKLLLAGAMILGRLEIFTVLVLITPSYWRK